MRQMTKYRTVLTIDIEGGLAAAFAALTAPEIFLISNNLGDAKSIVTHPATTTHQRLPADQKQRLGITPGLVRISVGLKDPADLIADLLNGLVVA